MLLLNVYYAAIMLIFICNDIMLLLCCYYADIMLLLILNVYYAAIMLLLLFAGRILPHVYTILKKNQNGFRTNRSTSGQALTVHRILEGVKSKNLPLTLFYIYFSKCFDSINCRDESYSNQIWNFRRNH